MGVGAWIMLGFGILVLYGGFLWCLLRAIRSKSNKVLENPE
ncbi:MetS family NSS transporter small subunit [bacterium]|nr:MetS family NSS transporter small subunit [bacterium]